MARRVLGGIDMDPFSSLYWNEHLIKAGVFFTKENDCLLIDEGYWSSVASRMRPTYFINPPSGLVKEAWRFASARYREGACVFWVGFSLEQLVYLQGEGALFGGFLRCIPPRRIAFMQTPRAAVEKLEAKRDRVRAKGDERLAAKIDQDIADFIAAHDLDGPPVSGDAPTHGNYLLLMSDSLSQRELFDCEARSLGAAGVF